MIENVLNLCTQTHIHTLNDPNVREHQLVFLGMASGFIQAETGISLCLLEKQFGFIARILYKWKIEIDHWTCAK